MEEEHEGVGKDGQAITDGGDLVGTKEKLGEVKVTDEATNARDQ